MAEMSRIFKLFLWPKLTQISACFIRIFDSFFRLLVASVMKGMAEKGVGLDLRPLEAGGMQRVLLVLRRELLTAFKRSSFPHLFNKFVGNSEKSQIVMINANLTVLNVKFCAFMQHFYLSTEPCCWWQFVTSESCNCQISFHL